MKLALAFIAAMFLLTACGSNEGNTPQNVIARPSVTEAPMPYPEHDDNWYHQYKGSIAGKQVTLDLECTMGQISGFYSYDNIDRLIALYSIADSFDGSHFYLSENDPTSRSEMENDHWSVYIFFESGRISGQWLSIDQKKQHPIELKEVDYKNAYRFERFFKEDSLVVPMKGFSVTAHAENKWCMPGNMPAADKEFLSASILQILGCTSGEKAEDCIKKQNTTYFNNYRKDIDIDITEDESHMYNHEASRILSVAYNKNGFVILEEGNYQYMGGAHGMHGTTYTCLDVTGKKTWHLTDVLTVDSTALSAILETEARHIFNIPAGEKLSERLLVDTINITSNFHFTSAGIVFHYNPYEIASYADGEVSLFIPLNRLSAYLTPNFKKRMHLQ